MADVYIVKKYIVSTDEIKKRFSLNKDVSLVSANNTSVIFESEEEVF